MTLGKLAALNVLSEEFPKLGISLQNTVSGIASLEHLRVVSLIATEVSTVVDFEALGIQ